MAAIKDRAFLIRWAKRELGKTDEELADYSTEDLQEMWEVDQDDSL